MPRKTPTRYTAEFKQTALDLLASGKSIQDTAKDLAISVDILYAWRASAADSLAALRRENARLQMENDILKKAAIILGTKNPGSYTK